MSKKNNIFNRFPEFIHGEALDECDEFILHTRFPRFLARVIINEDYSLDLPTLGELVYNGNDLIFISSNGFILKDFIFMDRNTTFDNKYTSALSEACSNGIDEIIRLELQTGEDW